MDRLLSEREVFGLGYHPDHDKVHQLLSAQLAKTDKEWVAWLDSKCPHGYQGKSVTDSYTKRMCPRCWQERKESIGI